MIHHHHPNNKNCGIWGRQIKFSDGTRHPSDHLRFCRLLSIKVVPWPLQRKTCRLTERQGRWGSFWRSPKPNWETPKKIPRGIPTFSQVKPPGESSFFPAVFFGCFLLVVWRRGSCSAWRPHPCEVVGFCLCCGVTLWTFFFSPLLFCVSMVLTNCSKKPGGVGGDAPGPQRLALCLPGATAR